MSDRKETLKKIKFPTRKKMEDAIASMKIREAELLEQRAEFNSPIDDELRDIKNSVDLLHRILKYVAMDLE